MIFLASIWAFHLKNNNDNIIWLSEGSTTLVTKGIFGYLCQTDLLLLGEVGPGNLCENSINRQVTFIASVTILARANISIKETLRCTEHTIVENSE